MTVEKSNISQLGQELTIKEWRLYLLLTSTPQSVVEIYTQLEGSEPDTAESAYAEVNALIYRTRQKLGDTSIMNIFNQGYVSRRALIESGFYKHQTPSLEDKQ